MAAEQPSRPPAQQTGGKGFLALLGTIVPVLAVTAVLLHPTQITVRQWADLVTGALGVGTSLAAHVPAVNLTVSDALLVLAFPLWLIVSGARGTLGREVRLYPVALIVLFAVAALSAAGPLKPRALRMSAPVDYGRAAKQIIQLAIFFVCAYAVLVDYLSRPEWRGRLLAAFLIAAAAVLLVGLAEYARLRPPSPEAARGGALISAARVDSTFGFVGEAAGAHEKVGTASNRNVLAAWVTLALPLLWAVFLHGRRATLRAGALVGSLAAGLLLLQAGLWAAALLAVLALSFARGRLAFALTAAGMLLFYGALFSLGPQKQGCILLDSVMLHTEADAFRTLPIYEINPELDASGEPGNLTRPPFSPWQQKYIEWQPALVALAHSPLLGVGVGNYQRAINQFYMPRHWDNYRMPVKATANLMETGANPFYAVWLAETGLVGLLGFFWLVASFLRDAARGAAREAASSEAPGGLVEALGGMSALKRGACAALGAAAFGCLFTDYWVRGVGIAFVLVLAISAAASAPEAGAEAD